MGSDTRPIIPTNTISTDKTVEKTGLSIKNPGFIAYSFWLVLDGPALTASASCAVLAPLAACTAAGAVPGCHPRIFRPGPLLTRIRIRLTITPQFFRSEPVVEVHVTCWPCLSF